MKIPKTAKDISGMVFGNQRVLEFTGKQSSTRNYIWKFECLNCGNVHESPSGNVIHNKPKFCVICKFEANVKHGHTTLKNGKGRSRTYSVYTKMMQRAFYKKEEYLKYYHDVDVCDRWSSENGFINFLEDMGECPSNKHSLNRIRSAKLYSKETCEWSTDSEQVYDQVRKHTNKTGVTGVVWREPPRGVWQANLKHLGKWNRYYYGDSYNECVICRVVAELIHNPFSRTLEDFSKNGINETCISNGINVEYWIKLINLHNQEKHKEILKCLYDTIISCCIEYKQDLNFVESKIKGEFRK